MIYIEDKTRSVFWGKWIMATTVKYRFSDISEHDMDLLFLEEFACSKTFLSLFTNIVGIQNANILSLELSKTDVALGESDITVIIESGGKKIGLLIEDKIDAIAMPEQSMRYFGRGQKGIERGDYEKFYVFIIAPDKYLLQNNEAHKYPNKIAYETILKYFHELNDPRSDFKIQQITQAIDKQKSGYQVVMDLAVTEFWSKYSEFQKTHYPDIYFIYNGEIKGSNATWPRFKTVINGLYMFHKTEYGFVDLTFEGCSDKIPVIEQLLSDTVGDYIGNGYTVHPTGKSAAIRLVVPVLDLHKPFDEQKELTDSCLAAVKKMSDMVKQFDHKYIRSLLNRK